MGFLARRKKTEAVEPDAAYLEQAREAQKKTAMIGATAMMIAGQFLR